MVNPPQSVGLDPRQTLGDLVREGEELGELLSSLTPDQWSLATPCEGWDARSVMIHMADAEDMTTGIIANRPDRRNVRAEIDAAGGPDGASARQLLKGAGLSGADVRDWWWSSASDAYKTFQSFSDEQWHERIPWSVIPITRASILKHRFTETWVHHWDISTALGRPRTGSDALRWIADFSVRMLPYAFKSAGVGYPNATLDITFDFPSGRQWSWQQWVGDSATVTSDKVMTLSGPVMQWVLVAARRIPGRDVYDDFVVSDSDALRTLDVARAFVSD